MAYDTLTPPFGEMFRKGGWSNDYDFNLGDNEATSITALYVGQIILAWADGGQYILAYLQADATPYKADIASSASSTVDTGELTGTTGADGDFTVSAHSDGLYYIENRTGGARNVHVRILS